MTPQQAIQIAIDAGQMIALGYLEDLTDQELFHRPAPGANHINWQLGHLIVAEHQMINQARPGSMPPLPDGFAERYAKENAGSDDPSQFLTKEQLLSVFREQRAATLRALSTVTDEELDRPSGVPYAPTVAALFSMQGTHWVMHAGQWAVIRRQCGRPPLY